MRWIILSLPTMTLFVPFACCVPKSRMQPLKGAANWRPDRRILRAKRVSHRRHRCRKWAKLNLRRFLLPYRLRKQNLPPLPLLILNSLRKRRSKKGIFTGGGEEGGPGERKFTPGPLAPRLLLYLAGRGEGGQKFRPRGGPCPT